MSSPNYLPVRPEWLDSLHEEILAPDLPIVDAHHHFYERPGWTYLADDYLADARSGHNICASVYMQALTRYRTAGPEWLRPVGETAFVAQQTLASQAAAPRLAQGIVAHADLRRGAAVREVLTAHVDAGLGRLRGIRHLSTWDGDASLVNPLSAAPRGLLLDSAYRQGVAEVAAMGLSYDAWLFFHQLPELLSLAKAFPELPVIVNHCGGVVRIGPYASQRDAAFNQWRGHMQQLAALPNVYVKLGGLGMRINGFDFHAQPRPPSSAELTAAWAPWIHESIEAFGARRCMFESNFPVDKASYSYAVGWNAFKRLTASASDAERRALFAGTASRVYRLDPPHGIPPTHPGDQP